MLLASAAKNKSPGISSSNAFLAQRLSASSTALIRLTLSKCRLLGRVYAERTHAVFNFQVAPSRLPESVGSTELKKRRLLFKVAQCQKAACTQNCSKPKKTLPQPFSAEGGGLPKEKVHPNETTIRNTLRIFQKNDFRRLV